MGSRMNKVLVQHFRDPAEVIIKDEGRPVVPKAEGRPPVLSDSEDDDEDGDSSVMESV
jgi:hypothetical protein